MSKKIEKLKPIDVTKYKVTETGQVVKMTEEKLCGGKTFKEVMQEVELHISDKEKIAKLEKENAQLRLKLDALEGQIPWQDTKDKSEVIRKLTKAKELLRKFLDSKNIDERCVAESEAEHFLKNEAKESCPDCFCEDCVKEDCEVKKLGLVQVEK